jgi:hypothetical protein
MTVALSSDPDAALASIQGRRFGSNAAGSDRTHSAAWMQRVGSNVTTASGPE